MAQTLNDAADGFEAIGTALDSSISFYSEPVENLHTATPTGIAAEVFFSGIRMVNPAARLYEVTATVEFSTPSHISGWSAAVRRIRDLTSPYGSLSFWAAVLDDDTLGGRVTSCVPVQGALGTETRKGFNDGERWTAEISFRVQLAA